MAMHYNYDLTSNVLEVKVLTAMLCYMSVNINHELNVILYVSNTNFSRLNKNYLLFPIAWFFFWQLVLLGGPWGMLNLCFK